MIGTVNTSIPAPAVPRHFVHAGLGRCKYLGRCTYPAAQLCSVHQLAVLSTRILTSLSSPLPAPAFSLVCARRRPNPAAVKSGAHPSVPSDAPPELCPFLSSSGGATTGANGQPLPVPDGHPPVAGAPAAAKATGTQAGAAADTDEAEAKRQ